MIRLNNIYINDVYVNFNDNFIQRSKGFIKPPGPVGPIIS